MRKAFNLYLAGHIIFVHLKVKLAWIPPPLPNISYRVKFDIYYSTRVKFDIYYSDSSFGENAWKVPKL